MRRYQELKKSIALSNQPNKPNYQNLENKKVSIEQAIIFHHQVANGITKILIAGYDNEFIINHSYFPDILDYFEGTILDVVIDTLDNVLFFKISDKSEINGFAKFFRGCLRMADKGNHAIIKASVKVYVPEWICENFYERNRKHKVYYLAVDKSIKDEAGETYDKVALQIFIIDK